MRVCLCATHPKQYNGYAKVGYELSRRLAAMPGVELTYFGFQNLHPAPERHAREIPAAITVYDAAAAEDPKTKGFGIEEVTKFFSDNTFDVVLIYNDMIVINAFLEKIAQARPRTFKIVAYVDQVYLYQKKAFIDNVNRTCDGVLGFTPAWTQSLVDQGITLKTDHLRHGVDPATYFPVPRHLARKYFGLSSDDFIVMNLNRNQPRKRWDICLKAFAEAVSRVVGQTDPPAGKLKLLIATSLTGAWSLLEIFDRELTKRGVDVVEGRKHLIVIDAPQKLSDYDVNILMNAADVGINTCDGEGFGLCQFEQASLGVPQIVPNIGGFADFFGPENATLCEPVLNYYVDHMRDGVGGEAQICDYLDFTSGILAYYRDPARARAHGEAARKTIADSGEYSWDGLAEKLRGFLRSVAEPDAPEAAEPDQAAAPDPAGSIDVNAIQQESDAPEGPEKADEVRELKLELAELQAQLARLSARIG